MVSTASLPVILLVLGGSIVGLCWWSLAPSAEAPRATLDAKVDVASVAPLAAGERLETRIHAGGSTRPPPDTKPTPELATSEEPPPGSERGLRAKYLALEAAHPGHLAAHAQEWLSAKRPTAEKVAWLLALHDDDAAAATAWMEFACRLDDPASEHGESVAAFALGFLERQSARESAALAALGRAALDTEGVDVALRRRAASTFASHAGPAELQSLGQALLREPDESLRAGVVIALEARKDPASRRAVDGLLALLRPGSAAFLARQADGTP